MYTFKKILNLSARLAYRYFLQFGQIRLVLELRAFSG